MAPTAQATAATPATYKPIDPLHHPASKDGSVTAAPLMHPTIGLHPAPTSLPNATLRSDRDEDVKVLELVQDKGAVIFFFEKSETPNCTRQAQLFQEASRRIEKAGFRIIGVSADPPHELALFSRTNSFTYMFLSDPLATTSHVPAKVTSTPNAPEKSAAANAVATSSPHEPSPSYTTRGGLARALGLIDTNDGGRRRRAVVVVECGGKLLGREVGGPVEGCIDRLWPLLEPTVIKGPELSQ